MSKTRLINSEEDEEDSVHQLVIKFKELKDNVENFIQQNKKNKKRKIYLNLEIY